MNTKIAIKFSNIIPFEDIYLVKDNFHRGFDNLKKRISRCGFETFEKILVCTAI